MKIIVKEANREKITAEIVKAEGKAKVRRITFDDVNKACEKITRHLGIPKKAMVDVWAIVDIWAQDFPNAYKFTPESTQFAVKYTRSGWAIYDVFRDTTHRASRAVAINLTETAKAAILTNASTMSTYEV